MSAAIRLSVHETFLMNLSLAKVFTITEGKTIQFRWENSMR